jgi:hypothetical protein
MPQKPPAPKVSLVLAPDYYGLPSNAPEEDQGTEAAPTIAPAAPSGLSTGARVAVAAGLAGGVLVLVGAATGIAYYLNRKG